MYNQKLVVAIKSNGKVLREFKDTVYMPFSSEYQISIKNLNTVRALVNITLDGTDVCPGGLVVNANQTIDLERWIKNGNLNEGNKFKFIERTAKIEQHKGIGLEDGVIRVEYQFEQPQPQINIDPYYWKDRYTKQYYPDIWCSTQLSGASYSTSGISGASGSLGDMVNSYSGDREVKCSASITRGIGGQMIGNVQAQAASMPLNDAGITVAGSKSEQKFTTASWFPVQSEKHVIVLKLLGETADNKPILKPVTVKAKPTCTTCGRVNKATNKFCSECGTSLEIV